VLVWRVVPLKLRVRGKQTNHHHNPQSTGHPGQVSGAVGDLKHPGTMAGIVEHAVQAMGGLDSVVISGGNGGSEYLVRRAWGVSGVGGCAGGFAATITALFAPVLLRC
jgi:hypothetical protein